MSSDSHQLRPFSKLGLLLEERICPLRVLILNLLPPGANSFLLEKSLMILKRTIVEIVHYVISFEYVQFS